jgi:2-dehydropantoate 2-reductase
MHILILGAGALGSLLGARLSQTEAGVSLFTTNRQHVQSIQQSGLTIEELDGSRQHYALSAHDALSSLEEPPDLVIVVVKTYDIENALAGVADLCNPNAIFLTLQNGIGNWERVVRVVGKDRVLVGTTAQGATLVEPGLIRHGGSGPTFIGEPQGGPSSRVFSVVDLFQKAGLKTEARDRMQHLIWEKLHANVGINAITALTGTRNGFIAANAAARELCFAAVKEAMLVARAKGFEMDPSMPERVLEIARSTAVNRSSMGQDVDRRKRTEIDSINGAIVALGEESNILTPVNQTLTRLVKILEANYG